MEFKQIESGPHCSFAKQQTWAPSWVARLFWQAYQSEMELIWLLERQKQFWAMAAVAAARIAICADVLAMILDEGVFPC